MEPISTSLNKWMRENKGFQEQYNKLKKDVLDDPLIQDFLLLHPEITENVINRNINKLFEYKSQSKQCSNCSSLKGCQNILPGYSPTLYALNNDIHLTYSKCSKRIEFEKQKEQQNLIHSLYMPKEILEASMVNIYEEPVRRKAIHELIAFIDKAKTGMLPSQGMYLYGPFGVGKTYILGAIANRLKDFNISSMLIYMPEFVREIRDSIKDDSINQKINYFKTADVLMFDDIGAETQSAWFRDEVLGAILQYRMMEGLPVFFTSNYSIEQLEKQIAETTRGGIEKVKAGRIMERIKKLSKEIHLDGENYRN